MENDMNLIQREILVDPKQSPVRLDKFIMERIEKISRNRVQSAITDGLVLVNDGMVKANYKVRPGDRIILKYPEPRDGDFEIVPQKVEFEVVYEDETVLVINKPAGLVVHPGIGNPDGTLVNGLAHYFKSTDLPVKDGNEIERMGLVHRIDKNTTGLLVIAKTNEAMTHLAKQFHDKTAKRQYIGLIWGEPEELSGSIEGYIGRDMRHRKKRANYPSEDQGKWAKTNYEVLEPMYYVSLVKCRLETGRTHQIRVHMSHIGHPLFADDLYGGDRIRKGTVFTKYRQFVENCFQVMNRHALHAQTLGFEHPVTGEWMEFGSELPEDFTNLLDRWRSYLSNRKDHQ